MILAMRVSVVPDDITLRIDSGSKAIHGARDYEVLEHTILQGKGLCTPKRTRPMAAYDHALRVDVRDKRTGIGARVIDGSERTSA